MTEKEIGDWVSGKYEQAVEWGKNMLEISKKCVKYFVTKIHRLLNILYS
jgi:hypothetical protein